MSEPPVVHSSDPGAASLGEPGQTPAPEVAPVDPVDLVDPIEPYRRWATVLFVILALIGVVGSAIALGAFGEPLLVWELLASVGLFVATVLVVVAALRQPGSWAVHAIAPICYVIIAAAAIRVVVALSQGSITIPLEGIGALMVLTRNHRSELLPTITDQGRWRVLLAVGAIVVAQILPYAAGSIADGAPFGAEAGSLDLQVAIDCTAGGEPGGDIGIRSVWSWQDHETFSPPVDGLVVMWRMTSPGAGDTSVDGVVSDQVTMSHPNMWQGSGAPASSLTQPLAIEQPSLEFGIDVAKAGLVDGSVEFGLRPSDPTVTSGSLEVWAAYAHGDRWLKESDTASCSW